MTRQRFVYRWKENFHIDEDGKVKGDHIHYNRRRWCNTADGKRIHPMTTRYTWELSYRNCTGPRGGRALSEHPRWVYYLDGRFYRNEKVMVGENQWANVVVPLDGTMWDMHPTQSSFEGVPDARITCEDGWPTHVTMYGDEFEVDDGMWQQVEDMLCILRKKRFKCGPKGPRKVA